MARHQRHHLAWFQQTAVDLTSASADVALTMKAPSIGAVIDHFRFGIEVIGIGSATPTHTISVEEELSGGDVLLSNTVLFAAALAVGNTVTARGNGVPVSSPGSVLNLINLEAGTVTTGAIGLLQIAWHA